MTKLTKEQLIEDLKASTQNASGMFEIGEETICELVALLTEPSAPVSVPDLKPVGFLFVSDDGAVAYSPAGLPMKGFNLIGPIYGDVNACRAAMLQAEPASNSDELPPDYLQGHKDGLEWAAQLAKANHPETGDWLYDDPIELSKAIRKGPDMPLSDGNSPVIQDGWIKCSERMPDVGDVVLTAKDGFVNVGEMERSGANYRYFTSIASGRELPATHWQPLPAAPQQEGKQ
ncbi:DUF551 domain-containing protein [Citrobacter freundii]|uniref:DUF551 domain-containing protein n=1 Tax=Citrobacter freundii TaxID=546 RepID=UPI0015E9DA07|nr:DUF551 domain-containing protein [Citrobacter freundii]